MREIKFRFYGGYGYENSMYYDEGYAYSWEEEGYMHYSDATWMQWTGLKDKNDKDIYNDDIVEFVGGTCDYLPCGIYSSDKYEIGTRLIVQKLLSGYTLAGINMVGCDIPNRVGKVKNYDFWNHSRSLVVIGNIHENPELIK